MIELSLEPCYAGLQHVSLLPNNEEGYFWFQFVEGCGYDTRMMTPDEGRAVAKELNEMADELDPCWVNRIHEALERDPIAGLARSLARKGVSREELAKVMDEEGLTKAPGGNRLINLHRDCTV